MRITILGASGFIGKQLTTALRSRGDEVITTSLRDPVRAAADCNGSDALVNLAGAAVSERWTEAQKREIERSRVELPRAFIAALANVDRKPTQYVSASAVGYYGTSRTATFSETSPPGTDFLARVCTGWESTANGARALGMRVAIIRTGLVLAADGGALGKLLPIFRLGLGGVVASGEQWYSWIHIDDQVALYLHVLAGYDGVLNATAPEPVTNQAFTAALGAAVGRPAFLPTPAFVLSLILGAGAVIVTEGQRVLPEATLASGFRFKYSSIDPALRAIVS